jgi:uncharacterized protein with gpF-like domain
MADEPPTRYGCSALAHAIDDEDADADEDEDEEEDDAARWGERGL